MLNHVSLTVRDREASAAFYGRHFGLARRIHDDPHLLILGDDGGSVLALYEGTPPAPLPPHNHFGFALADHDAVRAARTALRGAGVAETEWQDDGWVARVQVEDPDGYRVELYAF